jgi:hypothetical protein
MEVTWALENVKQTDSFYSKLQTLLLVASTSLWKKYHPTHKTVFYCDPMVYEIYSKLDIFHLWDDIRILVYPEKIKREVFWAVPKTKIISETKVPILMIDHDFLIYRNMDEYLKDEVLFTYNEKVHNNWYPSSKDAHNRRLKEPVERVNDLAANVSFLYLPDPQFARKYAQKALNHYQEFTEMNFNGLLTNYMILSEQLMLKQMLCVENIPHKSLSKFLWDCNKLNYTNEEIENGIWNLKESYLYYKHYGLEESYLKEGREGYSYDDAISFLYRCIKSGKLIDTDKLKEKLEITIENK